MTGTDTAIERIKKSYGLLVASGSRGARYAYDTLLKPRSYTEDDKRRERILTIVLFCISMFLLLLESTIIGERIQFGPAYNGINIFLFTGATILCLYVYYLARIGYFKVSAYLFIILYFLLTLYGSIHFGTSMPAGLLSYVLIITMASIVISTRAGALVAGLSIGAIAAVGFIEHASGVVHQWRMLPLRINDIVQYSVFFVLLAAVSWLSNSELERSLRRARTSERLLKEERDNLELLVEARTRALREAEHERMAQLSRFAEFGKRSAGLFHDLLSPLGALTLTVDGLMRDSSDNRAVQSIAAAIDATRRMQQFMDTIKRQLAEEENIAPFSPLQQIEESVRLLHYQATHANVAIVVEGDPSVALVGDVFRFTQIVTNLLSNAIESYGDSRSTERTVAISVSKEADNCMITIADHGCGIAKDIMPHIFETFFTTKESGIGLGLATVKDSIEKCFSGTITCDSAEHIGTMFTLTIPLNHADQNHAPVITESTAR